MEFRDLSKALFLVLTQCDDSDTDGIRYAPRPKEQDAGATAADAPPLADDATTSGARRISQREYDNILRDLLGDTTRPSQTRLPAETRTPFDNDYAAQEPSAALVEGAELLASEVSQRLLADPARRDKVVGCTPTGPGDQDCMRKFIVRFGRSILRRPLSDDEVNDFMGAQATAQEEKDFYAGVDVALRAFLQHPRFLYRLEVGAEVPGRADLRQLTDWEVAARLSFFFWGTTPDERLLDRAAQGGLHAAAQVREVASEMVADPRAAGTMESFHAMWLGYEKLSFDPVLAPAMQAETNALLTRVVFAEKRPWQDVFRVGETFVTDALATHYGLPTHGSDKPAWTKLDGTPRRGVLSQGAFLALGARGEESSPTLRGKAVRLRLLCQIIPPPPPGTKFDEPPAATAQAPCKKDRYLQHAQSTCAGCHKQMDPIGFGLENYDGRGRFRTKENTNADCPIDGNGELAGIGAFNGPAQLGDLLAARRELTSCITTQAYRFMTGRTTLDDADTRVVRALVAARPNDFRFDELLLDLVSNPAFLFRRVQP
jgi:Protein of unknown function (DUF1592)/Protein of unknown function (DUF1588)/Protein of unknown function (DUF1595)/Protein of unknown function (DUF1585)/Protein of unknown function (DUF1587)